MVLDTDTHCPEDLLSEEKIDEVLRSSGLTRNDFKLMRENSAKIIERRI